MRWTILLLLVACHDVPTAQKLVSSPPPVAQSIVGSWSVAWASAANPAISPTGAKCFATASLTVTQQDSVLGGSFRAFQITCDGHAGVNLSGMLRGLVHDSTVRFYLGPPGDDDFTQIGAWNTYDRTMQGQASLTFSPYGVGISDDATLFTLESPFTAK